MESSSITSELSVLAFTEGLEPAQLDRLAELATPVQWEAGMTVFREGDHDSLLYVVEEGHVAIEVTVPGRGPVTILTVGPGEVFGWSSLFYQRPKTAAARIIEPTRALVLDTARLRALCDADPELGYALTRRILHVVTERLKATRIQLLDLFQQN
jgi:CRP-like cAMP-binding protein